MRTYKPTFDLSQQFPSMRSKQTVLLHPRRGHVADVKQSKMGGRIAWPENESWPVCPIHRDPMVAVVQITKPDVPELRFPAGKNLFQMLWCPQDHEQTGYAPLMKTFWRDVNNIDCILSNPPEPSKHADSNYTPIECQLHFERVEEYPAFFTVDSQLVERIDDFIWDNHQQDVKACNADEFSVYMTMFGAAPVSKVGGYFSWIQDAEEIKCDQCGKEMSHLLTVSSSETENHGRWRVIDDENPDKNTGQKSCEVVDDIYTTGLMLGDMGMYYVGICRNCEDLPTKTTLQCC